MPTLLSMTDVHSDSSINRIILMREHEMSKVRKIRVSKLPCKAFTLSYSP